ncbi:Ribosome biogenesis protein Slx9-like [Fusarium oxysporum f. sp. vasinfectum]|nr:Ribosome biogenesis protein Slx9-like [Fusarium oxysporum f. sp. vasinfectum]KAK2932130.1 Ribosome biogenesis protein Slx9-like [Fusarium oxysporum f. sp. vasinfectum]
MPYLGVPHHLGEGGSPKMFLQYLHLHLQFHTKSSISNTPTTAQNGSSTPRSQKALRAHPPPPAHNRPNPPPSPQKVFRDDAAVTDSFLSSKRDKRLIKHSSFVSRIQSARISKSTKRRRPSKKLAANLESLADALPELEEGAEVEQGKVRHKSLKSKRGALKRKERVVKGEMERFGVSMARLTQQDGVPVQKVEAEEKAAPAPTANRWAALRGYISSTMEQNPAFAEKN